MKHILSIVPVLFLLMGVIECQVPEITRVDIKALLQSKPHLLDELKKDQVVKQAVAPQKPKPITRPTTTTETPSTANVTAEPALPDIITEEIPITPTATKVSNHRLALPRREKPTNGRQFPRGQ